ncbi:bud site selection protein 20 [Apium graveolens]|uniref:bud site selection protein 20 n=1 Tax=Apium graveolens TaxID=4045 RepID=UPI003D78E8B7
MGGKCPHRKVKKRRYSHKQFRRDKFETKGDDAVYDELKKTTDPDYKPKAPLPLDEDLPGMGQYYCLHCDRYFANVTVRDEHFKTKKHRKRLKIMAGPAPHTQLDADLAGGMGMPDNGPKLMSM